MPKMSPGDLRALLAAEKVDALSAMSASKLSDERARALDYYLGDMSRDMPAPEGRSRAVSSDVADTIEGLMPTLMDIFCGGDEVVRFEPGGPEDVAAAEQETDYVNHVFMQGNPGFLVLYSFIKDALLSKVGIVKVWWETREETERARLRNRTTVDPRDWSARNDMTINVGLGTGSKSEQLAHLNMIITAQKEAIAASLVSPKNLFNSAKELTKLAGHKNVDTFFTAPGAPPDAQDPASAPIKPPADPKAQDAQQRLELDKAKAQADAMLGAQKNQAEHQASAARIAAEASLKREQLKLEFDLKVAQMNAEFALKREQMAAEMALRRERMQLDSQAEGAAAPAGERVGPVPAPQRGSTAIDDVRMGGDVG